LRKVCTDYENGDEQVRAALAKRYGARRLAQALEEFSSMELIVNTSKQCPQCKSWMQVCVAVIYI
jgi:hypothetical protein